MEAILPNLMEQEAYWTTNFAVTDEDLEYLFNLFLETETPLSLRDLTLRLITYRLGATERFIKKQLARGVIFQPKNDYEVGQTVVFPTRDYQVGEVIGKRDGQNEEYGPFQVIKVRFENGKVAEFASSLLAPHALNTEDAEAETLSSIDPEDVLRRYGRSIAVKLRDRFEQEEDVVYIGGRWFLRSLLLEVNIAHLHLAEAVLDMHDGGPLTTEQILQEIGMEEKVNHRLQIFSMDLAMQQDERFDEVGPAGQVLWFLRRMEPESVQKIPEQLRYTPIPHDPKLLTSEMRELILEIDDELSPIDFEEIDESEATITLTYPYRRTGTLPLNSSLQHLFPTAFETNLVITTLVDAESGEERTGWVVREQGYVYGLGELYKKYMVPIGGYVTIRRHEDLSKLIVDFSTRRARTEFIRLAVPDGDRLRFENHKRSIGTEYDDLMIFGIEDLAGLDEVGRKNRSTPFPTLLKKLMSELVRHSPQSAVHIKTLYSAVNLLKRCPPEPIMTTLASSPEFEYVGGGYWRMA
ncbi:MAG: hypothetical protein CUN55_03145 [Phototrophicales bacterium]|nr:MAG: hypothetical protein CUN55_03145 [Phototrophicales bacterium]